MKFIIIFNTIVSVGVLCWIFTATQCSHDASSIYWEKQDSGVDSNVETINPGDNNECLMGDGRWHHCKGDEK